MKKLIALLLCLVFCLSLASCGENKAATSKKTSASSSSSAVEKTASATKSAEKSKTSSKKNKKKKKKKSSKTSSKTSSTTSSKASSKAFKKAAPNTSLKSKSKLSSSTNKPISKLEKLICNSRGWKSKNNSGQTVLIRFLRGGAAKVQVFNRKGVLVHNKMEYSMWSLDGDTLTIDNSVSKAEEDYDKYRFKDIDDSVLDKAPLEKSNEKYINYIPLDSTGLKKDEFYVSKKYFCFYMGSDGGKDYCKLYRAK